MTLDRTGKENLVLASAPADAVNGMINFVDQGFDQGLHLARKQRNQSPEALLLGNVVLAGKNLDKLLAPFTGRVSGRRLLLNRAYEAEHCVGIATEKVRLLVFEEPEEGTVFLQFATQAFND